MQDGQQHRVLEFAEVDWWHDCNAGYTHACNVVKYVLNGSKVQTVQVVQRLKIYSAGSVHHGAQVVAFHDFLLEQVALATPQNVAAFAENTPGFIQRIGDDGLDLFVDDACRFLAVETTL